MNGVFVGVIYGLLAVALVVVYRVSRVINFASGEIGMLGAFVFTELWLGGDRPLAVALAAGIATSAALGAATEVVVVRPLRGRSRLAVMMATFGVGNLVLIFASRRYSLRPHFIRPLIEGVGTSVAGLTITPTHLLMVGLGAGLLLSLAVLMHRTPFGLKLRAVALDPEAAAEVGVEVDRVSLVTWALAGAISGASAIVISSQVVFSVFFMTGLMLRALAATLLGGLTSVVGAFVAGVLLGAAEGYVGYRWSTPGGVELALAALILLALLVRPRGLVRTAY